MTDLPMGETLLDRTRPMRDQIYAIVRQMILTGRLKPGEAIDERTIAGQLSVSRTPVHEALKKLSDERLVEVRAQSGTRVTRIDRQLIEEAHVIRRALEVEGAGHAARRMTPMAANRIEDIHMLHTAAIERRLYAEAIGHDDAFHRAIHETAGYPMLWRAIEISKAHLDRCRHMMLPREGMAAATLAEHRAILDALAAGDAEAARAAMRDHLDRTFLTTLDRLDAGMAGE